MSELSILIDESGDFGETRDVRDYYLVTFVFHDQKKLDAVSVNEAYAAVLGNEHVLLALI